MMSNISCCTAVSIVMKQLAAESLDHQGLICGDGGRGRGSGQLQKFNILLQLSEQTIVGDSPHSSELTPARRTLDMLRASVEAPRYSPAAHLRRGHATFNKPLKHVDIPVMASNFQVFVQRLISKHLHNKLLNIRLKYYIFHIRDILTSNLVPLICCKNIDYVSSNTYNRQKIPFLNNVSKVEG